MCLFLKLEFDCSDSGIRHSKKTEAICRCDNPLVCIAEETSSSISPMEKEVEIEDLADNEFKVYYVGGDCKDCAQKRNEELAAKDKAFATIENDLAEMTDTIDKLDVTAQPKPEEQPQMTLAQIHHKRSAYQPETICASGTCMGLVCVSIDGRRGKFCQRHTCAAQDWGCLADISTTRFTPEYAIYCPLHTCGRLRCGVRVADFSSLYCERHRKKNN
ncbi:hypothetical protein FZEAL_6171 [Fusarium zealandicum]|uniref:Uncharacterized protein n=1 Tax=Fusarium zealandicum TaxID=1053134 RepID=A0A8H4UIA7_9HYPO|nr:hypothetical protein FZEAL_6171 [Fusarium zealandicum]